MIVFEIPEVGELMYASFPANAEVISNDAWYDIVCSFIFVLLLF